MPNWCWSYIEVSGDDDQLDKLVSGLREHAYPSSVCSLLNTYLPTPPELLQITSGSLTSKGKHYKNWVDLNVPRPCKVEDAVMLVDDEYSALLTRVFGANDWYVWNMKNYGTKWTDNLWILCDQQIEDRRRVVLRMETAWSFPRVGFDAIFKREFPDLSGKVVWAAQGPDGGYFYFPDDDDEEETPNG